MLRPVVHLGPVFLVIAVLLSAASCGDDETAMVVLGEGDMNSEIPLATGDVAEVRLSSNPSTGFRWVVSSELTDVPVRIVDEWHEAADTTLIGAPGTDVFRIEATSRGAGVLRFEYRRQFEPSAPPNRVAEFIIRVDGAPWPPDDIDAPDTTSVPAPQPDDDQ